MAGKKRSSYEDELRALAPVPLDPRSETARARLREGLGSKRSLVAARAAKLIREHNVDGLERELTATFTRFLDDGVKNDPSCAAKLAALEALDYGDWNDEEPFLTATRVIQLEPAWGPPVDTAAGVRARGVLGLARISHPDVELVAATLFTDAESPVRQAAADALAHRGARTGAAVALLKLRVGDADPLVTLAAMSALMTLAPAWGRAELGPLLGGDNAEQRELAAMALGQSRDDAALGLVTDALTTAARPAERAVLLRAIGLHRSDRALEVLLGVVAEGRLADARAALTALGVRRFEPHVVERARAAAARNDADLAAALAEAFPDDEAPAR